ncbi:LCP family protein [Streptomyces hainanensis]|uniref:LytR family transcriptional regulator n=1 Tax=Streptomyces hainanensis TaxID=402648 RepID=A0A4R4SWG1_9ACTN|nr:LCP family protein [Streptomyces hainanensis]TDC68588.1 LytR family transcriptional regulator [Streptomyces hainanensis]
MRRSGIRGEGEGGGGSADRDLGDGTVPLPRATEPTEPAEAKQTAGDAPASGGGRAEARRGRKKPKPRWRRVLLWTSGSLAFLVLAAAGAVYFYIEHLNGNIESDDLNLGNSRLDRATPNADGQVPLNILLLGSDSREGGNQALGGGSEGGERADVQLLMHASADRSNITLISVPRDTMITIPECTDPETGEVYPESYDRINASLGHGGPGCTVATWEEMTGIPIDHFMMLDFEGVVSMADAVGGVPVCVDANVADPESHLRLPAGDNVVEGEQALQWLRTRHAFGDGGDVGRTRGQQMYLSNMADELQGSTSLTNPGELMALAEAATNALTVDNDLASVQDLYGLGENLRSVPGDRINSITMPWLPDPENPEVTVVPDPAESEALFALVRDDIPLDDQDAAPAEDEASDSAETGDAGEPETPEATADPPADITVLVRNGTGDLTTGEAPVDGRASDITEELLARGYTGASTDLGSESQADSVVLYPTGAEQANAEAVAEAMGLPHSAVRISPSAAGITLVVGNDWREGADYPEPTEEETGGETGTGGEEQAVDDEAILFGDDKDCMSVNPDYTW